MSAGHGSCSEQQHDLHLGNAKFFHWVCCEVASLCTTMVLLFLLLASHSISAPFSFNMFFFEPFSSRSLPKPQCIGSSQMSKTTSPFVLKKLFNHHICLNALLNLTTSLTASVYSKDLCDLSHLVQTNFPLINCRM